MPSIAGCSDAEGEVLAEVQAALSAVSYDLCSVRNVAGCVQ